MSGPSVFVLSVRRKTNRWELAEDPAEWLNVEEQPRDMNSPQCAEQRSALQYLMTGLWKVKSKSSQATALIVGLNQIKSDKRLDYMCCHIDPALHTIISLEACCQHGDNSCGVRPEDSLHG